MLYQPGYDGSQGQNKGNRTGHAQGRLNFFGHAQKRTDTQKLGKNDIVDEYRSNEDGYINHAFLI